MKNLASTILTNAKTSASMLESLGEQLVEMEAETSGLHAESAISNVRLLLDRLVEFYSDNDQAAYFPHHADSDIHAPLTALTQSLGQFQSSPQTAFAVNATVQSDQLYAAALRLGLVTFGFDANEMKAIAEEVGAKRKSIKKTAAAVGLKAEEIIAKAQEAQEAAGVALGVGKDIVALRESLVNSNTECEQERRRLTNEIGFIEKIKTEAETQICTIADAEKESTTSATEAKLEAKSAVESAKASKAALDSIQQAKATAKVELDAITEFYAEIEQHQKTMIETKKEADAKFNELNAKYISLQAQFGSETAKVITRNQELQIEIKSHLQNAAGASLFHAFDTRRSGLNRGKWVWALVMIAGVLVGAGLSWWLADALKSGPGNGIEPVFFVKLSAIIPVTFAIIFAARQYANERRTEEEYAFKSAISLSLMPYKDLLQKMKIDGHEAQSAFVEKLLLEIFDNPVLRVYADGESKRSKIEKAMTLRDVKNIISVSKDLDVEKVRQLVEILGGNLSKINP